MHLWNLHYFEKSVKMSGFCKKSANGCGRAGHLLIAVRVFGPALFILSGTKRQTHVFLESALRHFRLFILRPSNLGLFSFRFQPVARKKKRKTRQKDVDALVEDDKFQVVH